MARTPLQLFALLLGATMLIGCPGEDPLDIPDAGSDDDVGLSDTVEATDTDEDASLDPPPVPESYPVATCDDLDPESCAFPWPSNLYLAPDEDRATGYRLHFGEESLPTNVNGTPISPELLSHLDGYDLGVPIMVRFPDLDDSTLPGEYSISESMDEGAQILLFEVGDDGLKRVPYWAELDVLEDESSQKTLFIRPAVILETSARYIVALRDLQTIDGAPIEPSEAFADLVEGDTDEDPVLPYRQARFDELFGLLESHGIERESLTLAWDFITASTDALHSPMLTIRDDAFDFVAEAGTPWTIGEVVEYVTEADETDRPVNAQIGLELRATFEVPHYMKPFSGVSGSWQLNRNEAGEIERDGTRDADILVRIPHRALDGEPMGVVVYGHGLLGSRWGLHGEHLGRLAEEYGYIMIAVDMVGMSNNESNAATQSVIDINNFVAIADRLHQGILEYLLTARTAREELPELAELTSRNIEIDTDRVHYFGASQGGIFGGTFMALTEDVSRGYLAVPGNNYSTLLHRSTNFVDFNAGMAATYPGSHNRNTVIAILSLMWSTTEPVSFLRHIRKEPFDGTPNDVLLAVAKGDWQVATITNEVAARSGIEIPLLENYDAQREPFDVEVAAYPHQGSGTVLYDFGNPWPDRANDHPEDEIGDPHGWLSTVDGAGDQIDHFFHTGEIIDVCDGSPCQFPAP